MHHAAVELNQQMLPVLLALLFVSSLAWLFLSSRLYNTLRDSFPELYESFGSPGILIKKNGTANSRFFRFLFRRDYETTGNLAVIRLCRGLRYIAVIYAVCLVGCFLLLLDRIA